jgi:hypothetical protein
MQHQKKFRNHSIYGKIPTMLVMYIQPHLNNKYLKKILHSIRIWENLSNYHHYWKAMVRDPTTQFGNKIDKLY